VVGRCGPAPRGARLFGDRCTILAALAHRPHPEGEAVAEGDRHCFADPSTISSAIPLARRCTTSARSTGCASS
jgi:hypothetical protein